MGEVVVSTEIAAPAATVWGILTDFSRFGEWNPFIREIRGAGRAGATLRVRVRPSIPFVHLRFRPIVLRWVAPLEIHWRGRFLASWLGSGDHVFAIEPLDAGRVRFVQRETFSGVLPRLASKLVEREARRGFETMNNALKQRAERRAGAHDGQPRPRAEAP